MNEKSTKAEFLNQVTRALMAIIFTVTVSTAFLWGVIRDNIRIDAAAFIGVIVIAIGWWYGQQNNDRKRATDQQPNGGPNGTKTDPPAATP